MLIRNQTFKGVLFMLALIKNRSSLNLLALVVLVVGLALATTSPPKVTFLSPANGAAVSGVVKVVVSFSASSEQPVGKVELYLDRQLLEESELNPPLLSGEQVYFLNTVKLANGPHSLLARAYSGSDVGESAITIYINNGSEDTTPPIVEILSPKDQAKVSGKVEVKIKALDDNEVKYVMLFINDKFKFLKNYPPFNDIWDTTRYPNGPYILQAFAYDSADNKGESKPVKVIVDNPTGQTTLGEEKTGTSEGITPPSVITPPPTAKVEKKEGLTATAKGSEEPAEASKTEKPTLSLPTSVEKVAPPTGKGQAVAATEAKPKEISGMDKEKEKMVISLNLPTKTTPPSTPSKGQSAVAGASPKEAMKERPVRTEKNGGLPVLPPLGPMQAKEAPSTPITAEKPVVAQPEGKTVVSSPPASKPTQAKGTSTPQGESVEIKQNIRQKPLLIVSKPEENLNLLSQGSFTLGSNYKVHTVQKGEYLLKIARAYGVPVETLASVNDIRNPDLIVEGQKLLIPSVAVFYNDNQISFPDAHPFVQNNLPLLPFRAVFETAGGTVIWHPDTREVEAHKEGKDILLKIGSKRAQVNEQTILMEVAAFIKFDRTYVPATFFHYALDAEIRWDPQTGHLYISAP